MAAPIDLTGHIYGHWTVVERATRDRYLVCRCDCGITKEVFGPSMRNGASPSCGHVTRSSIAARFTTHGHASRRGQTQHSVEYTSWCRLRQRCENEHVPNFADYGGRGIKVCERWRSSFQVFLADMGYRPGPGYSVDRIDVNGDYAPENCRWATAKQQARNRRSSVFYEANGETLTIAEWAERTGVRQSTIARRIRSGLPSGEVVAIGRRPNHPGTSH